MRIILTADLHYNDTKSRPLADEIIDRMNTAGGDVLAVVTLMENNSNAE